MFAVTVIRRAFAANLHKVSATSGEEAALETAGIREPTIQHYLAWHRSMMVLVVLATILSASLTTFRALTESEDRSLFSAVTERLLEEAGESPLAARQSEDSDEEEHATAFGRFADGVHLASLYAAPLAALAALFWWTRFKLTFRILAIGWAFAFFAPMLIALCPWTWWGNVEPSATPGKHGPQHYRAMAEGVLEGAEYLVMLLPTVLSLIPGVQCGLFAGQDLLIGLDERTSLLRPMDLADYALEFVGRLLFMTVLGADLFMCMNLAAWNNFRQFMRSGKAEDYDRVMHAMQQISQ